MLLVVVSQAKRNGVNGCRPSPTILDDTKEKTSGETFLEAYFVVMVTIMWMIAVLGFLAMYSGTSNCEKESHMTVCNFKWKVTLLMEIASVDIMKMR